MAVPKKTSVTIMLFRHRQNILAIDDNNNVLPPIPKDMDFAIPCIFSNFTLHDSGPGSDR